MPQIIITIDCFDQKCGHCEMMDQLREHCKVFQEFIDDDDRCAECIDTQEQAELLE